MGKKKVYITESQLKYLIEYHHAVPTTILPFFDRIVEAIESCGLEGVTYYSKEEIQEYLPEYKDVPFKQLKVMFTNTIRTNGQCYVEGNNIVMELNYDNIINTPNDRRFFYISHEFTHYLQNLYKERLQNVLTDEFKNEELMKTANRIAYIFSPLECSARLSAFSHLISTRKIYTYRSALDYSLEFDEMYNYLIMIKNDVYDEKESLVCYLDKIYGKTIDRYNYNKAKDSLLRKLKKQYYDFCHKIKKILKDNGIEMDVVRPI